MAETAALSLSSFFEDITHFGSISRDAGCWMRMKLT